MVNYIAELEKQNLCDLKFERTCINVGKLFHNLIEGQILVRKS